MLGVQMPLSSMDQLPEFVLVQQMQRLTRYWQKVF